MVVPHPGVYPGLCKRAHKDSLPFSHRISHSVEKLLLNKKQRKIFDVAWFKKREEKKEPCNLCVREPNERIEYWTV